MKRLILNQEVFGLSSLMEKISHTRVKDCFKGGDGDDTIYFVVAGTELGKAIGKGAVNIKKLQRELNKKVRVIGHHHDLKVFIRNIIAPLKVEEIVEEMNEVIIKENNKKTKSLLIGRNGKNLKLINRAVKRFFNKEVRVE